MHGILITTLLLAATPAPPREDLAPAHDVLVVDKKEVECQVLWRWHEDGILVRLPNGRTKTYPADSVTKLDTRRDRTAAFLALRKPGAGVDESWRLVQRANKEFRLPYLARVQAYDVLRRAPAHEGAHEFLGHKAVKDGWRWLHEGKLRTEEEFHELIATWDHRLVLEGEHFTVQSDAGLERTIQTLFDLESLYVLWMELHAETLRAAEDVVRADQKMTVYVYRDRDDKAFRDFRTQEREPFYEPSQRTATAEGDANPAFTYYASGGDRPVRLFDVATQQVLYSTLVLGRYASNAPPDSLSLYAHWLELGMGYWMERRLVGPPGHPALQAFALEPKVAAEALERAPKGPLSGKTKELPNLIALETRGFYTTGDLDDCHRAKARAFFAYLWDQKPVVLDRRGRATGETGRNGAGGVPAERLRHSDGDVQLGARRRAGRRQGARGAQ
jgi:hypothetical protein